MYVGLRVYVRACLRRSFCTSFHCNVRNRTKHIGGNVNDIPHYSPCVL